MHMNTAAALEASLAKVEKVCTDCGVRYMTRVTTAYKSKRCKSCQRKFNNLRYKLGERHVGDPEHELVAKSACQFPKGMWGDQCEVCNGGQNRGICAERVALGLWVLCEQPDRADLLRARAFGVGVQEQVGQMETAR